MRPLSFLLLLAIIVGIGLQVAHCRRSLARRRSVEKDLETENNLSTDELTETIDDESELLEDEDCPTGEDLTEYCESEPTDTCSERRKECGCFTVTEIDDGLEKEKDKDEVEVEKTEEESEFDEEGGSCRETEDKELDEMVTCRNRPLLALAKYVLKRFDSVEIDWPALLQQHVDRLRLTDDHFKDEKFNGFSLKQITKKVDIKAFLFKIVECQEQNPIIVQLAEELQAWTIKDNGGDTEDMNRLPDAVAWAVVLHRITRAARGNWRIVEKLIEVFHGARVAYGLSPEAHQLVPLDFQVGDLFEVYKTKAVEAGMKKWIEYFQNKKVDPTAGKYVLPINIWEAVGLDTVLGNLDNAQAGIVLAHARPGGEECPATKSGPTQFSAEKGFDVVQYRHPLPVMWDHLYSAWNLAVTTYFKGTLHFWAKLVNPAVGCYCKRPDDYIYNRAVSLYLQIHWALFERMKQIDDAKKRGEKPSYQDTTYVFADEWTFQPPEDEDEDESVTLRELFGELNENFASSYQSELKEKASKCPQTRATEFWTQLHNAMGGIHKTLTGFLKPFVHKKNVQLVEKERLALKESLPEKTSSPEESLEKELVFEKKLVELTKEILDTEEILEEESNIKTSKEPKNPDELDD
eukprot:gnl/Spiro4/3733_TR1828_c0_g1_i1.p1 gnl/Spiro4/3733_TR1828_c0_g1~~gnl/Spiro4/3733_TR1828_c0_g1_i1.p1  ORF type:complete len:634 (-),score=166.44 gnl/Spiro4/3733_TR1828_c0_g1_i1:77-1978(-)